MMEIDTVPPVKNRKRKPFSQISHTDNDNDVMPVSKKIRGDLSEKRAGTISRIILKNFMCHSLLDVDFTNNINIIIGNNGSGKSAILTGLVVGLGGKANVTNRGSSVKGFIKAGRTSGSVEIELYNGGHMAYRPNIYGNKIIIIRNINISGSSSYKIKNEVGNVISTQSKEISNITTGLNIQVDNPICILNQDTSRNFLSSKDPKHKFTLFMKATKLETLAEQYKIAVNNKKCVAKIFEDKEKNLRKMHTELKHYKQKIENHKSIAEHRKRVKQYQNELFWAKVRDFEEEFNKEQRLHDCLTEKYEKLTKNYANKNDQIDALNQKNSELEQQIKELKECISRHQLPQRELETKLQNLRNQLVEKQRARKTIENTLEDKTKDVETLQKEINSSNTNKSEAERLKQERQLKITKIEEKIKGIDEHLQTVQNDLFQIRNDASRKDEERDRLRDEIRRLTAKMNNDKSSLNALKGDTNNNLLIYGRDMPRLKQAIEENKHRFKQMPRGPLGSYIRLKDKKWAVAVEGFLGPGMLNAFAVDNKDDNQLLVSLFQKYWTNGRMPTIITSKFFQKKHDVSKYLVAAPNDCRSIYDVLQIDDPIVSNCLVDQMQIESILLIPNSERAMELMSDSRKVPKNCKQSITINGDIFYPDPNYRTYSSRYHKALFLQVDTKEHIQQLENNLEKLQNEKAIIEKQFSDFNKTITEQDGRKQQLEERIKQLNGIKVDLRRKLAVIRDTPEMEVPDVEILEQEMISIGKVIIQKKIELKRIDDELTKIKDDLKIEEQALGTLKKSNKSFDERINTIREEMKENTIKIEELETSDSFQKRRIEEVKMKLDQSINHLKLKKEELDNRIKEASQLGDRVETRRRVTDIAEELSNLERLIQRINTQTESVEEITEKYQMLHTKYNNAFEILTQLDTDIKELNLAIEKRSRHYNLTQDYFISSIQYSFEKMMKARQFEGTMDINMLEKTLNLIVRPQNGTQGLTPTTNLSGGERSFSTVAFLYSLWQTMEFPFYILDEFDVYMDKLNRTEVLNIMIKHAKNRPALQFIFLTPQDVSFVDKSVSILRLEDPER